MGKCSITTTRGASPGHRPNQYGTAIIDIGMTTIASAMTTIAGVGAGSHAPDGPAFRYGATGCPSGTAGPRRSCSQPIKQEEVIMDKDRIAGAARGIKGSVKEAIGKVIGDAKLQSDGKAERTAGKIQNAVGGMKDTVREIV
jgi:uncharacterized protein YjbJ (UPF0337 family)